MKKIFILALLCISTNTIHTKILILIHAYNRPDFIQLQAKTFDHFLEDDYQIAVFNDASKPDVQKSIENTCKELNIAHYNIPQHLHLRPHDAGSRHTDSMNYSFNLIGYNHNDIVALVDSDVFLIRPFSIEKYLKNYDIAGELQGRGDHTISIRYLSPNLCFINMNTLPNKRDLNFGGGIIEGFPCDIGGQTYFYFQKNPHAKRRLFNACHIGSFAQGLNCPHCNNLQCANCINTLKNHSFPPEIITFIHQLPNLNVEFFLDMHFLHYRGGSNWDNQKPHYHQLKSAALNNLITTLLK